MKKVLISLAAIIGCFVTLAGVYVWVLVHPGLLFQSEFQHGNYTVHSDFRLDDHALRLALDSIEASLATSDIYEPSLSHDIIFAHANPRYRWLQSIRWSLITRLTGMAPALTYNQAAIPYFSHLITFRVPDLATDALVHPESGTSVPLVRTLTHEAAHSLLQAHVGSDVVRYPLWKQEGYAEYVAESRGILSAAGYDFWESVERLTRTDLSWLEGGEGQYRTMAYGCQQRSWMRDELNRPTATCYYIARVLMEYLLDVRGLTTDQVMSSSITESALLQELLDPQR